MNLMLQLQRFSFGVGDRFAHQASAQLRAFTQLAAAGVTVVPVWNKSNREHTFIGSEPQSVYDAAAAAVRSLGWKSAWYVDADHIQQKTVDRFLAPSNFFTIDVADSIGKAPTASQVSGFVAKHPELIGTHSIPGIERSVTITAADVATCANKYLLAVEEAGRSIVTSLSVKVLTHLSLKSRWTKPIRHKRHRSC